MITYSNTRNLKDLILRVDDEFENRVFYRFEKDDTIFEKGYGTFAQDTMAVAGYIRAQSEKYGHSVHAALLGKCSYEYLTVLMGVPCAGGVSIPLDVQASEQTLVDNITKADTDMLFFDIAYISYLDIIREKCPFIKRFVCLKSVKNFRSVPMIHRVYRNTVADWKIKSNECAMIIFTSGTTGVGKGVMLSHGNLIDNMFCTDDQTEICLNVLPIHHIFCISSDVLLVLRYGSTLCQCDDLSKILYYMQLFRPTVIRVVPMMAKMLCNRVAILRQQYPDEDISEVRARVMGNRLNRMVSGGGYLSGALSSQLFDLGITAAQGYGMSECSPKISVPDYSRKDKVESVGRPVTGAIIRIVDGEIQIKSPSVMMGYYNDPELTKEAITEDGYLRTGDIGYLDEDEFLWLSGRIKNLIILSNGENVSPEMIENKFDEDRLVSDIVAYGEGDRIVAEVYPNYEYAQLNDIQDIQAEIDRIVSVHNAQLPPYAQISKCSVREKPFPKTSSKKIARTKLFEEKEKAAQKKKKNLVPVTDMQKKLFELVAREIGTMEFSTDDDLYQIGLDSMGSTMLISDIVEEMGRHISLGELLDHPTVLQLEKFFTEQENEAKVDLSRRDVYPLTSMQMYFAYVIPGNTTGNLPFAFKFSAQVDLDRLKEAIYKVLDAHPVLKAVVKPTEQKYLGIYRDDSRLIDIPVDEIDDEKAQEVIQNSIRGFNFMEDHDIVHIRLFRGQTHKYLLFDVAHFMGDGMTMNILMEDLKKAYDGEEVEKEEGYTTYEYILDNVASMTDGRRAKDVAYVDDLMKGIKMNRSLLGRGDEADLTKGIYGSIRKRFDSVARKSVLYYGREHSVSENVFFITAFNYCIALFSGEDDVFCSSIHSGRTDSRWNRLACSIFRTYFCRYTRVPHQRVDELLKVTGKQILDTMKLITSVPREGEMFFQFQGDILEVDQVGGDSTERIHVQLDSLPFHLQVMYDDKGYYTELRYWENRFDRAVLNVFLTCFEAVLRAMMDEPSVRQLKQHMPDEVYPRGLYVEAGVLHKAAGRVIIPDVAEDEKIRVYVFDESYNKKPYGAWGPLYIMDYEPAVCTESQQYPYGPGMLYNTGLTARVLPDGTVDFLHMHGRKVLTDGARGRIYYDLKKAEEILGEMTDAKEVHCYLAFDTEVNEMSLMADISSDQTVVIPKLQEQIGEKYGQLFVPKYINVK